MAGRERLDGVAVAAHAVAVAVDLKDGRVVEKSVEDRGGDGGVFEDRAPLGDPTVGRQDDRAVLVAAADDLEQMARGFAGHREIAEFVNIRTCGPAQNRIVFCQRPSIAARVVRATRSAAVV